MDNKKGKLFILYGPSGSGKSTLMVEILKKNPNILTPIITYTTRAARAHEIQAKDYHFISDEEFLIKQSQDYFIYVTNYLNYLYGTPQGIFADLELGKNLIAIFDRTGAQEVKNSNPDSVLIWITAPIKELENRLADRYSNNNLEYEKRISLVQKDIHEEKREKLADYTLINTDIEFTLRELDEIIKKEIEL